MNIEDLGQGAVEDTPDDRDFQVTPEMMGAANIDWTKEFRLPAPPDEDQGISDSCVAHAWSYYHWQLRGKPYSRRDLFARIALTYGAEIRAGGKELTSAGQATKDEVSDPSPQTPTNMRDKTGLDPAEQASDIELSYFVLPQQDITGVAWGVQAYKGVVFGVIGNNAGWQDMENPTPPSPNTVNWGHALYAMGSHLHNGQKCIIAKSSWCNSVKEHHIKENYFNAGMTFNAWTLIPRKDTMSNTTFVHKVGTSEYGFYVPATSEESIKDKALNYGVSLENSDGTVDFSKAKEATFN